MGATFFFATHDGRLLDRVSRRITLVDGRVATDEVVDRTAGSDPPVRP